MITIVGESFFVFDRKQLCLALIHAACRSLNSQLSCRHYMLKGNTSNCIAILVRQFVFKIDCPFSVYILFWKNNKDVHTLYLFCSPFPVCTFVCRCVMFSMLLLVCPHFCVFQINIVNLAIIFRTMFKTRAMKKKETKDKVL